jgi:type II secretory pathway component PulF
VARLEREATDAKTEFWMGIVGPIMSFLIGAICLGIALAMLVKKWSTVFCSSP